MIKKIIKLLKSGIFFDKVIGRIKAEIFSLLAKIIYGKSKIKENKIIFIAFQEKYACNPKAIANEILKQKLPYELIWVTRKKTELNNEYPKQIKLVDKISLKFYKEIYSSKIIVCNANIIELLKFKKRNEQILMQTWHGSLGFKRIDAGSIKDDRWVKRMLELKKITDYCISNSTFETHVFSNSYWDNKQISEYGHPRNDILFNRNNEYKILSKKIKQLYNLDEDTKICLYAPTYRNENELQSYGLDSNKIQEVLTKKFGGKWSVFFRLHHRLKEMNITDKSMKNGIDVTDYPDMQELLCVCDVGITDYSSWMCDYVLTKRPGFLYIPDYEDYIKDRGFYYPLETTPFPIAKNNNELYEKIINFDENKYLKDVRKFLTDKGCLEDGEASKRIVNKIKEIIP